MILECIDINKSFGEKHVLKDLSFSASSGSAVGLLGRNGAGKTTSIRIIMSFFGADSGKVLLNGQPISPKDVKIGYLPEERGLYPKKKIGEQMMYLAQLRGLDKREAEKSIRYWLERVELGEYYDKKLDTLSKGNQQKIQLALTLINDPDIVIFDEPFSGLDPVNAMMLKNIITEFKTKDKIALFSSHQMSYVEEFCDDVVILHDGRIALGGNLRTIKRGYPRENILLVPEDENIENLIKIMTDSDFSSILTDVEKRSNAVSAKLISAENKDAVLKKLIDRQISVSRFEIVEPTLEQIFISVAQ